MTESAQTRLEDAARLVFKSRLRLAVYEFKQIGGELIEWEQMLSTKYLYQLGEVVRAAWADPNTDVEVRKILVRVAGQAVDEIIDDACQPEIVEVFMKAFKQFDFTAMIHEARRPR